MSASLASYGPFTAHPITATFISFIGADESETLKVSPIPCLSQIPRPILDFIVPLNSVPASVIPKYSGQSKDLLASS